MFNIEKPKDRRGGYRRGSVGLKMASPAIRRLARYRLHRYHGVIMSPHSNTMQIGIEIAKRTNLDPPKDVNEATSIVVRFTRESKIAQGAYVGPPPYVPDPAFERNAQRALEYRNLAPESSGT